MSAKDLAQRGDPDGYILVDLDRTLARYEDWTTNGETIGAPIPVMVERVVRWLKMGKDVRIFTARASRVPLQPEIERIQAWCATHIGKVLPVQNWKDFGCIAIWDDLAITVEANTGWRWTAHSEEKDPLDMDEELDILNCDAQD